MNKEILLYPPSGGKIGVKPHPSKIDEMLAKGWLKKPKNNKNKKGGQ